jgi:hypothetical protein
MMAAGAHAAFARLCCFTSDQLIEIAPHALGSFFLHQEREIAFIELPEPVVPADFFERILAAIAGKIETNHAHVLVPAGSLYARRSRIAILRPLAYLVVINQCLGRY